MSATVTRPDGSTREVRNLGWLLRHAADVKLPPDVGFVVHNQPHEAVAGPHAGELRRIGGATLEARLKDGTVYRCRFESIGVLHGWLDRPSFGGYWASWPTGRYSEFPVVIGSEEWRGMDPYAF